MLKGNPESALKMRLCVLSVQKKNGMKQLLKARMKVEEMSKQVLLLWLGFSFELMD